MTPASSVLLTGMHKITIAERRARLGRRHYLAGPTDRVDRAADALVGLHSSDPATVYLSCQSRVVGFKVEDLEQSLYEDRSLLRMLGMRRTMFVVPTDLGAVMDAACTRHLLPGERQRLIGYLEAQEVTADGDIWLAGIEQRTMAAIAELGEATARELKTQVPELGIKLSFGEGKKWAGQVGLSTRVLFLLATASRIVRARPLGSWTSTQYRWARTDRWVHEPWAALDSAEAQSTLAKKWLRAYGPGTLDDVKWWTGWGVRVTRSALSDCGAIEVELDGGVGYVLPDDLEAPAVVEPWAALLPSLDSTVMGWKDRGWYLGPHRGHLFDRNGNAGPTIWLNGRVVGGWVQATDGEIRLAYLEEVSRDEGVLVESQAEKLQQWLGERRFIPRFRTPTEQRLSD